MDNLSIVVGSTWEQGFIRFNQFYKVFVQAKPEFRRYPEDFENMFVKNDKGEMVPYSSFMTLKKQQGLNEINRYNLYPSAPIQAFTGSRLQQRSKPSRRSRRSPPRRCLAVTASAGKALAYDEAGKGNLAIYIFLIVVVFVYLVLVGQYESFILPLAVIMSLPVGIFGSFLFLQAMGLANDVYCPDWSGHAGRSAGQERDSHRRIRGATAPRGSEPQGGSHRRRKTALPADSDDLLRLHRRSDSVGPCHRPRGDRKPHDWHHRGRRDAPGHRHRGLGHSRPVLLVR